MRGGMPRVAVVCVAAGLLAACSTVPEEPTISPPSANGTYGAYKIGEPYEVNGVWYYPREQPDYDETGIASWYGPNYEGRLTANGEVFDGGKLTAAHPTLPMPVKVRVTNLRNGRSLVLRVNDRGPFVGGRIIDVSERAAELLGFHEQGTAPVRVTYLSRADLPVGPLPDTTVAAVRATAAVRTASLDPVTTAPARAGPDEIISPDPPLSPELLDDAPPVDDSEAPSDDAKVPVALSRHYYVQAGIFSVREQAEWLKNRLSAAGNLSISSIDRDGQLVYSVRIGPFDDIETADAELVTLAGAGARGAQVVMGQ